MEKYIPTIGDVVLYGGGTAPKVVVDMISHENFGSCCYDRKYFLCDESFIKNNNGMISNKEIERHGIWVEFRGMNIPDIRKCEDIAPYAIILLDKGKDTANRRKHEIVDNTAG